MEEDPKSEIEIIFDSTYDGMIAVKSDGVVTLFNYTRITGLLPEAVIGRAMINIVKKSTRHFSLESTAVYGPSIRRSLMRKSVLYLGRCQRRGQPSEGSCPA